MTDQRLEELRQRWEADPGSRVFLQLAEEYRRLGRKDEAIHVLEQGLERSPNHLSAKVALGRCRLEKQEYGSAAGIFEEVLERDPT
ncbi:MAG: tetratricopeptide repeat protein, partial [Acidobacteria bacterium]|nr:tetratricopeptide repeat protein [Acidobacteriota bacterium]